MRKTKPFTGETVSRVVLAILVGGMLFSAAEASPQQQTPQATRSEIALTFDPAQSKIYWIVGSTLHTVHGTFALTSGLIHFNPETGIAGGQIVVSATSGQSGNSSRDARMHKEILETAIYPEVIFRPKQVEGTVALSGVSDVKLHGVVSIHGADHDVTVIVHVDLMGNRWSGSATFEAPYVMWGIKDPSNFLLKVKPVVNVELEVSGMEAY